ncbi:hypothetical protein KR032_005459 [Drosophila birchii]|nr:hypothetical protein KR032_005459 [Drosophila birchii]
MCTFSWQDFVVITSGCATIGMEVGILAGLRTFRVLRALKTVSIMPGLKTIINALLHSFRQLAEVMTLTIFCLMVFALFALQVYMGELRNKCVRQVPSDWTNVSHADWQIWVNDTDNWLYDEEELPVLCGNLTGARHCPFEYVCLCLITLDYWENVYNMVLVNCGPMSISFFAVVVFPGEVHAIANTTPKRPSALTLQAQKQYQQMEQRSQLAKASGTVTAISTGTATASTLPAKARISFQDSGVGTFCVVSKRFRKNYIHRFTGTKSLFFFHPWSPARRVCVYMATNQFFDYCVMATILFNCIFLAMTETVGDFVVITSGYATIGMEVGNLAGLRTFRVLRALKTVSVMPGLKTIINALLHSFRQLAEVMTLTIFCLMVFALFALQVYMGELRNKCVRQVPSDWTNVSHADWQIWVTDTDNWLYDEEELPVLCGNLTGARHCPFEYVCLCVGENPNHGYTNFDNFMWSMLTTFQLITLDYWENVYNTAQKQYQQMEQRSQLAKASGTVTAISTGTATASTLPAKARISFQDSGVGVKGQLIVSSRQTSSNSNGVNRESSQDDSGVVDDHEEQEAVNELGHVSTVELALSPREVRLIKCNGNIARIKNHNVYALHQEFSSEVVVVGRMKADKLAERVLSPVNAYSAKDLRSEPLTCVISAG